MAHGMPLTFTVWHKKGSLETIFTHCVFWYQAKWLWLCDEGHRLKDLRVVRLAKGEQNSEILLFYYFEVLKTEFKVYENVIYLLVVVSQVLFECFIHHYTALKDKHYKVRAVNQVILLVNATDIPYNNFHGCLW